MFRIAALALLGLAALAPAQPAAALLIEVAWCAPTDMPRGPVHGPAPRCTPTTFEPADPMVRRD